MPEAIPATELADLFRRVLRKEVGIKLADPAWSWDRAYCGNVEFIIHELAGPAAQPWRVVIFNDCAELDYVASATAPDGRAGEFDQWYDQGGDPIALLAEDEFVAFEHLLEGVA